MHPIRIKLKSSDKPDLTIGHLFLRPRDDGWRLSIWLPIYPEPKTLFGADPAEASRLMLQEIQALCEDRDKSFHSLLRELTEMPSVFRGFRSKLKDRLLTQARNRYNAFQRGITTEIERLFVAGWPRVPVPTLPWDAHHGSHKEVVGSA